MAFTTSGKIHNGVKPASLMTLPKKKFDALLALYNQGKLITLLEDGKSLLKQYPDAHLLYNLMGCAQKDLGAFENAVKSFENALQIKPGYAVAYYNLGAAQSDLGRLKEAIVNFGKAVALNPGHTLAHSQQIYLAAHIVDWDSVEKERAAVAHLGLKDTPISPFSMLAFEDNPTHHRKRAELLAEKKYARPLLPALKVPTKRPKRLRIGYFSADFHNHATMYLMIRLFELHDPSQFEIYVYSYGGTSDTMRSRLNNAVHQLRDVQNIPDRAIAEQARQDKIDIAIDLKGYTAQGRPGIFAHRPAPLQVNYLGYPGTLGAPFYDYMIADSIVIPKENRRYYTEKIITLPHSYQVNDNSRKKVTTPVDKAANGLPEKGFVFACFNNNYKISPREFDIWMRLLDQVEGSVLWLLKLHKGSDANFRKEAGKRGIDPARIVFAERLDLAEHLARHSAADLFLDTFNVNAHTTASDALWAGLPLVTKMGEGFAARVAASLLTAIGLPELITRSEQDYEQLALSLATNPAKLQAVKEKLIANRDTQPLFDSERFTKNIEAAYQAIYDQYFNGLPPAHLSIRDEAPKP